ncbi:MAG: ComF family protein [Bacteroidales bacterium]|nr:ComF family protein [Bacteroidales bacterium]
MNSFFKGLGHGAVAVARDVLAMLFPNVCEVCGAPLVQGEKYICIGCMASLPRTYLHTSSFSEIHQRLACRYPLERAASYFYYYRRDIYSHLIRQAKYNNRPRLASYLAETFAHELKDEGFFSDIDLLLPVPMHWRKELTRGYNQSFHIAQGITRVVDIPIADHLYAGRSHHSQTRSGSYGRWLNSEGIYAVADPQMLAGHHVMIVDDVITSGATLIRCIEALGDTVNPIKISVLSLALARNN